MAKQVKNSMLTINLANESRLLELKLILKYESKRRGLSGGQTFKELIYESADFEHYPPEIIESLNKIKDDAQKRAIHRTTSIVSAK